MLRIFDGLMAGMVMDMRFGWREIEPCTVVAGISTGLGSSGSAGIIGLLPELVSKSRVHLG
jgi:hypothetical protein